MKKILKGTKDKKKFAYETPKGVQEQLKQLQKTEEGYTQIYEAVSEFTDAIEASKEKSIKLSEAFRDYSTKMSCDSIVLAGCLRSMATFQEQLQESQVRLYQMINERLKEPVQSFVEEDIKSVLQSSEKLDAARDAIETSNRRVDSKKGKAKVNAEIEHTRLKVEFAEQSDDTLNQLTDANAKSIFFLLDCMCDYLDDHYTYFKTVYSWMTEMLPEIYRYRDHAKKMKHELSENVKYRTCKPSEEELQKSRIFGVPLLDVLVKENEATPRIITHSIEYLEENGMDQEGLFRLSGGKAEIESMRTSIDRGGDVNFAHVYDSHSVSGLVKMFLRDLPEPLLTYEAYPSFIAVPKRPAETQISDLHNIVSQLPAENLCSIIPLFRFLHNVTLRKEENKMTPSNIATVLAPNVLYSRDTGKKLDATNIQEGLLSGKAEQMALANKVVELIVTHAPDIFTDEMLQKAQEEVTEIVQKAREDAEKEENLEKNADSAHSNNDTDIDPNKEAALSPEHSPDSTPTSSPRGKVHKKRSQKKKVLADEKDGKEVRDKRKKKRKKRVRAPRSSLLKTLKLSNEEKLNEVMDDVFSTNSLLGWVIIGYENKKTIALQSFGKGTVAEMVENLKDDEIQYCLVRIPITDRGTQTTTDVFIMWIGSEVGLLDKGRKKSHVGEVQNMMQPFHADLTAISKENFTTDVVVEKSKPNAGSHVID